jgi:hypothetical protein
MGTTSSAAKRCERGNFAFTVGISGWRTANARTEFSAYQRRMLRKHLSEHALLSRERVNDIVRRAAQHKCRELFFDEANQFGAQSVQNLLAIYGADVTLCEGLRDTEA